MLMAEHFSFVYVKVIREASEKVCSCYSLYHRFDFTDDYFGKSRVKWQEGC